MKRQKPLRQLNRSEGTESAGSSTAFSAEADITEPTAWCFEHSSSLLSYLHFCIFAYSHSCFFPTSPLLPLAEVETLYHTISKSFLCASGRWSVRHLHSISFHPLLFLHIYHIPSAMIHDLFFLPIFHTMRCICMCTKHGVLWVY